MANRCRLKSQCSHDDRGEVFRNLIGFRAPVVLVQQSAANAVECFGMSLHPFTTLKEAIKHLEESVKAGNDPHAKEALEHAKEAVKHAEESLAHAEQAAQQKGKSKGK